MSLITSFGVKEFHIKNKRFYILNERSGDGMGWDSKLAPNVTIINHE